MPVRVIIGYVMTIVLGLIARAFLDIADKRRKVTSIEREEVDD